MNYLGYTISEIRQFHFKMLNIWLIIYTAKLEMHEFLEWVDINLN